MMIVNKMLMRRAALPSFFSTLQFAAAVVTVTVLGHTSCVTSCPKDDVIIRWSRLCPYLQHSVLFVASIYSNMQALRYTSIETIIVFRAATPLIVMVLDRTFLGRAWPSPSSFLALVLLACGAAGYVLSDNAFQMRGLRAYTWAGIYFVSISGEMAYAKYIVGAVHFESLWGPVLHNNLAALPMMVLLGLATGELHTVMDTTWDPPLLWRIALSCVVSVVIAYAGWNCRKLVSAACYTVLGVGNKILTILVNNLIWRQFAAPLSNICLLVCLVAAVCYQQAPMRSQVEEARHVVKRDAGSCRTMCGTFFLGCFLTFTVIQPSVAPLMHSGKALGGESRPPSPNGVPAPEKSRWRAEQVAPAPQDCRLVQVTTDPDGPPPCHRQARPNAYVDRPVFSAVIQTFKDAPPNAMQLLQRLRSIPLSKDIIVNDDSHGGQSHTWLALLTGPNEFYVSSPNLHETRAYNRLSHYARGELVVFVQGDCCLPSSTRWFLDAVQLFKSLPRLAMLSARAGFKTVLNVSMTEDERNNYTWGAAPYLPLESSLRPDGDATRAIPFNFAPGVDNGPLIYRREVLLQVGGFDESYNCRAGHVAIHYDFEIALRFWRSGWQVGVYYGASSNGLGGRKSMRKLPMRQERHINEAWNVRRIHRLLRAHGPAIAAKIQESTRQSLSPILETQRLQVRDSRLAALGRLPPDEQCFQGIDLTGVQNASNAGGVVLAARNRAVKKRAVRKKGRHRPLRRD